MSQSLVVSGAAGPTLELAIAAWIDAKGRRSNSQRTRDAYADTLDAFRAALQHHGLDLDGDPRAVALLAQTWAAKRSPSSHHRTPVAPNTYNLRLAILSSFYQFAHRRQLLAVPLQVNPIELIERRPVQAYAKAVPLDFAAVDAHLAAIDRSTWDGLRDYALLLVALHTGRRASELAGLRYGDISQEARVARVIWRHCKGGKVMHDELSPSVAIALGRWLRTAYGERLATLPDDAAVWLALDPVSEAQHREHAITAQTIAAICLRRMGTSKVHTLRHTFAHAMEEVGAKVSEIQQRLGHANLATTGAYLAALGSAHNPYGGRLETLYGVSAVSEEATVKPPPKMARRTKSVKRRPQ